MLSPSHSDPAVQIGLHARNIHEVSRMAKSPKSLDFEIVDGVVLSMRGSKTVFVAIFGVGMVGMGFMTLYFAATTCLLGMGIGHNPQNYQPVTLFALAVGIVLLAFLGFAMAGVAGYHVLAYFKKERFVLGADALQYVVGNEVRLHLPYDNIRELNMVAVEVEGLPACNRRWSTISPLISSTQKGTIPSSIEPRSRIVERRITAT
jgi:hypothetical protein